MEDFAIVITHNCVTRSEFIYLNLKQISKLYPKTKVYVLLDITREEIINIDNTYTNIINRINNLNLNLTIDFFKYDKFITTSSTYKDVVIHSFFDYFKEEFLLFLDDDCILLNNGLIEWCYNQLNYNNIDVISEIVRPCDKKNKIVDRSVPRLERFSNWFLFIRKTSFKKNNITFIPDTMDKLMEYEINNKKEAEIRNMDHNRDDFGYIYVLSKKHKLNILNLKELIYFYNESDDNKFEYKYLELLKTDGIRQFTYYYYHVSHFNKINNKKLINLIESINPICYDYLY